VGILDGLSVINHRLGVFKGFLDCHKDGWLKAEIAGFTNTLRFKHYKPLVNLPGVDKPWGAEIRGCLTAPEGFVLCGADMTSLEDTTKRHYMQPLDPEYVAEMSREGFDPHLDLAKHAGAITQADIDKHNLGEISLKALRKNYKVVNYSATYGVGATKLSRTTGLSVKESKKLLNAFWDRNWAIPKLADSMYPREKNGKKWLKNPVSGYYHSLRSDKDKFSTLNQSTGVFCFDNWVALCRRNGVQTIGQFHDEIIALVADGQQEQTKQLMEKAIATLNDKLKLNVPLGVDAQFGTNYAEIH
jgi:DNA polymerase I-like protein with 3'-5' exonuclease and polymerase domains